MLCVHDQCRTGQRSLGQLDARRRFSSIATPGDPTREPRDQILKIFAQRQRSRGHLSARRADYRRSDARLQSHLAEEQIEVPVARPGASVVALRIIASIAAMRSVRGRSAVVRAGF